MSKVLLGIPAFCLLLARRRASAVYVGVAGGYGRIYDVAFVALARVAGARLYLHHDSYTYLQNRQALTATLLRVAGPSAMHIVGCDDMKERLAGLYGRSLNVIVASNITNIDPPARQPFVRTGLRTIGFISHIVRSKGIMEFFDVLERVSTAHPDVRALVAGTITDPSLASAIKQRILNSPQVTYVGPVYGDAKTTFYLDIDAFVFPTRHKDEADPRVISEAQAHGVVIVATDRGCIGSILRGGGGRAIGDEADFVGEAEALLVRWHDSPPEFSTLSAEALANAELMRAQHVSRLTAIIGEMTSVGALPVEV